MKDFADILFDPAKCQRELAAFGKLLDSGMVRDMRRWFLSPAVVFVAVAVVIWLLVPAGPITQANCDRIQTGMTESDVEEILGRPATAILQWPIDVQDATIKHWQAGNASILVYLDADGLVRHKTFGQVTPPPVWWRILHWLGFSHRPPDEVQA